MNFGPLKTPVRFWLKLCFIGAWTLLCLTFIYPSHRMGWKIHSQLIRFYSKGMNMLLGIRVRVHGNVADNKQVLFVSNHSSYLDIFALASFLPAVFIAKDDIPDWPVVGWISQLSGSIFISRNSHKTLENIRKIKESRSTSFILFPEGTTSDGNRVEKFNSAFFSLTQTLGGKDSAVVQPISIAYTRLAGISMGHHFRPYFSWFGGMDLAPHLKECLSFSSVTIDVTLHQPIEGEALKDRKKLAIACEQIISDSLNKSLTVYKKRKEKIRMVA